MNVRVGPAAVRGTVRAPASKSDAHRALICAALADRATEISMHTDNRDTDATAACLEAIGAVIARRSDTVMVTPTERTCRAADLQCGESGSTLRFMLPIVSALGIEARFLGEGRLPSRPISPLREELEAHGVRFSAAAIPFVVSGRLTPGRFVLPGNVSSQYVSGLMFALPLLDEDSEIVLTSPLESAGYAEMTVRTLRRFGIALDARSDGWSVRGGQRYVSGGCYECEGDWSSAAFMLVAAAVSGGSVRVSGLDGDSAQRDSEIVRILSEFGAEASFSGGTAVASGAELHSVTIDASQIPDMVPALAAAASCARGETRITGAARLRIKESDRIATVCGAVRAIGAEAHETDDGMVIVGVPRPSGGTVDCGCDHRIAMAFAAAACGCAGPVTLLGAEVCEKSYPGFFEDFTKIGGKSIVI